MWEFCVPRIYAKCEMVCKKHENNEMLHTIKMKDVKQDIQMNGSRVDLASLHNFIASMKKIEECQYMSRNRIRNTHRFIILCKTLLQLITNYDAIVTLKYKICKYTNTRFYIYLHNNSRQNILKSVSKHYKSQLN